MDVSRFPNRLSSFRNNSQKVDTMRSIDESLEFTLIESVKEQFIHIFPSINVFLSYSLPLTIRPLSPKNQRRKFLQIYQYTDTKPLYTTHKSSSSVRNFTTGVKTNEGLDWI